MPGGHIMPFWLAAISTSTPQSSIIIGAQPSDAMASTTSKAGWSPMASRRAGMSAMIPVAVSIWQTMTALIAPALSSASLLASRSGSAGRLPKSSRSTATPIASICCAQDRPKWPEVSAKAWSPGLNRLAPAASHAAWPLPI